MAADEGSDWFHTTQWSVVLAARDAGNSSADEALAALCQTYWRPLYTYLRRSGNSSHDAQDLTQSFFATLIDKDYLKTVDQQKGRFRSFLLVAIKHFVANQRAYQKAIKRGGNYRRLSLDFADAERMFAASQQMKDAPDFEFEYNWAITVLEQALDAVRAEFAASDRAADFEHLQLFLAPTEEQPSFEQLGEQLGLGESGARSAVHRLRRRYRRTLRSIVAQTVGREEDIDDELQQLMRILSSR